MRRPTLGGVSGWGSQQVLAHSKDGHRDGACVHPTHLGSACKAAAPLAGRDRRRDETKGGSHAVSVYWCFRLMQHPAYKKGEPVYLVLSSFRFFSFFFFSF